MEANIVVVCLQNQTNKCFKTIRKLHSRSSDYNIPDIGPKMYANAARTSTLIPSLVSQTLTWLSVSRFACATAAYELLNVGRPPDWYEPTLGS